MPFGRLPGAIRDWPTLEAAGLPISTSMRDDAARDSLGYRPSPSRRPEPVITTSVDGQVPSPCVSSARIEAMFAEADTVHRDGKPLAKMSRCWEALRPPDRVATTDLCPTVAALAAEFGTTSLLGASEAVNREAMARSRIHCPKLKIVGASHGHLLPAAEAAVVTEISASKPDVLRGAPGAPRGQGFRERPRATLAGVGIIKTSGGLFDALARAKRRALSALQRVHLERSIRLALGSCRLLLRCLVIDPHALSVMLRTMR